MVPEGCDIMYRKVLVRDIVAVRADLLANQRYAQVGILLLWKNEDF